MANSFKLKSDLKVNKNRMFFACIFAYIFALMFSIAGFVIAFNIIFGRLELSPVVALVLVIAGLILCAIGFYAGKKYQIYRSGVKGESRTYKILNNLSENFTILSNPVLHSRGKVAELDFVIIGSDAVFIVESKNHKGILKGKCEDDNWTQVKERGDKTYTKSIKNPVKQSLRQVRLFTESLSDIGISAVVFPVVYFADKDVALEVDWDESNMIRIIRDEKDLINYIVNTKGQMKLDEESKKKIVDLLTGKDQ